MNGWVTLCLDDLVAFRNGKSTNGLAVGDYPVFGSNGVIGTAAKAMYENAIILGRVGAYCGSVFYCRGKFWATDNTIVVEPKPNVFDARFAQYVLRHANLNRYAGGSAQPLLTQTNLRPLEFRVPPVYTQRRIASILGAYDDLIEVNRRLVAALEGMARGLFEEWFVRFRFPGHETNQSASWLPAEVPKGWSTVSLFGLATVNYGKNLPTRNLIKDGSYPVYGASKIIGYYNSFNRANRTIICGCRGSVGELQITLPNCFVTNNSFTFDVLHGDSYFWIFHALKLRGFKDVVGGAAQPQITLEGISSVELLTPPEHLRAVFQRVTAPMFEQIWRLQAQIANLNRTRDLLLPRLISGELSVDTVEAEIEDAA